MDAWNSYDIRAHTVSVFKTIGENKQTRQILLEKSNEQWQFRTKVKAGIWEIVSNLGVLNTFQLFPVTLKDIKVVKTKTKTKNEKLYHEAERM